MSYNASLMAVDAARELLIRRQARADVVTFARAIDIPGASAGGDDESDSFLAPETAIAKHHELILREMERTAATPYGRLMIFAPPGSAKSTYASNVFPARWLGEKPNRKLILASYGDTLARKMGRRTRAIVRQPRFAGIYGCGLVQDQRAITEFALTNGSEYMAAGILTGITGNRAGGLIIDDPVKGRAEANSKTVQDSTWDAYNDDLKSRLIPGGWVVIINTRWVKNDLCGRLLPESWNGDSGVFRCTDGMDWTVLCLQAKCETDTDPVGRARGEYLWPEWFDRQHWQQYEQYPITWASLFQQVPTPGSGILFMPEMIQIIGAVPAMPGIAWCRGWDLAATQDDGDYTVGALQGKLPDRRYVIADLVRGQWEPYRRNRVILATTQSDGQSVVASLPQDPGQAGKSQAADLVAMLSGYRVSTSTESGSKMVRAEAFAAQVNAGNVFMLRADWNMRAIDELRSFGAGGHDDIVDALSRSFNTLLLESGRKTIFG